MTANVKSPFILIREAVRRLRDGGRIVNISTVNTVLNGPGMATYAASKAALELLGHRVGGLRLPMVAADEAETEAVRAMLVRHGLLGHVTA